MMQVEERLELIRKIAKNIALEQQGLGDLDEGELDFENSDCGEMEEFGYE